MRRAISSFEKHLGHLTKQEKGSRSKGWPVNIMNCGVLSLTYRYSDKNHLCFGHEGDVTSVGSSDRAECDIFGGDFGDFWPIQATFVVGEPLCDVGIPS